MKLYYFQGSCALAPHIGLEWAGADYELQAIKRSDTRKPEFLKINPNGKVPVLITDDGKTLTQVTAILLHLAQHYPAAELGPADSDEGSYEMNNLLGWFNGDIHTAFTPYFLSFRYTSAEEGQPAVKEAAAKELEFHMENLDRHMADRTWVLGDRKSILDPYLYVFCRWGDFVPKPTSAYPNLAAFAERMKGDPGVKAAVTAQGMKP